MPNSEFTKERTLRDSTERWEPRRDSKGGLRDVKKGKIKRHRQCMGGRWEKEMGQRGGEEQTNKIILGVQVQKPLLSGDKTTAKHNQEEKGPKPKPKKMSQFLVAGRSATEKRQSRRQRNSPNSPPLEDILIYSKIKTENNNRKAKINTTIARQRSTGGRSSSRGNADRKVPLLRVSSGEEGPGSVRRSLPSGKFPALSPNRKSRRTRPTQRASTPSSQYGGHNNALRRSALDMINLRRFPGVLFRYRTELGVLVLLLFSVVYLMHRWGLVCTNYEIKREVDRLCKLYRAGVAVGNLCSPLCDAEEIHSISCISQHSKKQFVFTAKWNKRLIVIKSSRSTERLKTNAQRPRHLTQPRKTLSEEVFRKLFVRQSRKEEARQNSTEEDFENEVRRIAREKLNLTLTAAQLDDLKSLDLKSKLLSPEDPGRRRAERENIVSLLQSQEYLLLRLFSERDVFPRVLGTCGHFYAVEYLERPRYSSLFSLDDKTEWSERMRLAVAIMEFVEEMETNLPDTLFLCDVQMNHLGVAPSGRVKFLDLDLAYTKSVLETVLRSGRPCQEHKDCDFLDCKSTCNPEKNVCDAGVVNDNLQAICEKIFIGWTMSGKMIIPGLLMSEHTPASLSALLRLCAENGRKPVSEDLRQRLYTTLTEMHQILLQKLSSE